MGSDTFHKTGRICEDEESYASKRLFRRREAGAWRWLLDTGYRMLNAECWNSIGEIGSGHAKQLISQRIAIK